MKPLIPVYWLIFLLACSCYKSPSGNYETELQIELQKLLNNLDSLETIRKSPGDLLFERFLKKDPGFLSDLKEHNQLLAYLLKKKRERQPWIKASGILPLDSIKAEEVYRFRLSRAFTEYELVYTVLKRNDSSHYLRTSKILDPIYPPDSHNLAIMKNIAHEKDTQFYLSQSQWDTLEKLVNGAHFWSMHSYDLNTGLDGATWNMSGKKVCYYPESTIFKFDGKYQYHSVNRWSPYRGSFTSIGLYLIHLANHQPTYLSYYK